MNKSLRPWTGPAIAFLFGIAMEITPYQSHLMSGFFLGMAVLWAFFALFGSKLIQKWPWLVEWLPFLEGDQGACQNSRIEIVRSRLGQQSNHGRRRLKTLETRAWMATSEQLVDESVKPAIAQLLHRCYPDGSSDRPLTPSEQAKKEQTMTSLRVIQGRITDADLL